MKKAPFGVLYKPLTRKDGCPARGGNDGAEEFGFWLISCNQDSKNGGNTGRSRKINKSRVSPSRKGYFLLFLAAAAAPFFVYAGFGSFMSGLFKSAAQAAPKIYNSQNIPLLQAAVNIDPHPNIGGAEIVVEGDALVSEDGPSGGLSENLLNRPSSDRISVYVVKEGDTLSQIAEMFDVTVNTIRWANDISGSTVRPGQILTILPVSGIRHTVKSGDTPASIAKLYKADIEEILSYNAIGESTRLSVGDVVIVPDGEIAASASASAAATRVQIAPSTRVIEGYFMRPVPGPRSQGIHGYNAVDLASPVGTPIVAAAEGRVIISRVGGWNGGYGNYIVIEHSNGTQTLYAHNQSNTVSVGETVAQGEVIGYVGLTGRTTGAHVHFEIRGARNPF